MKKLLIIILQILIFLAALKAYAALFNGLVFMFWLSIFWMASVKVERPTHSPYVWLFCGIVTIIICGLDAYSWWQKISYSDWTHLDIEFQKGIAESYNRELRTAFMQFGVGLIIIFISSWKIKNMKRTSAT